MLVRLKRGLHRVEGSLSRPFHSRGRKREWDGLKSLIGILDQRVDTFGPLVSAVAKLAECIEVFDDQARARKEYGKIRVDLDELFQILAGYLGETPPLEATKGRATNLARGIDMEIEPLLRKKGGEPKRDKKLVQERVGEVLQGYIRLRVLLARFVLNESTKLWELPDQDTQLDRLPRPVAAWYSSSGPNLPKRNGCTANTRVDVLEQLREWSSYNSHPRLYWLNGTAGTGKTVIAYSFCEYLDTSGKLAASFFCTRRLAECRDANTILPSISHQLSTFSRPFRHAISGVISQDVDVRALPVEKQFESLIAAPLRQVGHTFPAGVVVVIDALDECEDDDKVDQILKALLTQAPGLPIKFLVTSRPEPKTARRMQSKQIDDVFLERCLDKLDPSTVREDVKTYIGAELAVANPSASDLDRLAELSSLSFGHAESFVRYILRGYSSKGTEGIERMRRLVDVPITPQGDDDERIDPKYTALLEAALETDTVGDSDQAETTLALRTVVCAQEPLTVDALAGLLGLDARKLTLHTLRSLWPVLEITETSGLVTPWHTSFMKYLLDQRRSGRFYCDSKEHNAWFAQTCFDLIKAPPSLSEGHASETLPDRGGLTADESSKMDAPELVYACRYWATHLELAGRSKSSVVEKLKQGLDAFTPARIDFFYRILIQKRLDSDAVQSSGVNGMHILRTVIWAKRPLTVRDISDLLRIENPNPVDSLSPLLQVSDTEQRVTILHNSLSRYLLDARRSGEFYCDTRQHNSWLAQTCLDRIKMQTPSFNICNLPSSYLFDREVPDLERRIQDAISPGLLYACQYWGAHLAASSASETVFEAINEFLSTRLLLWMEILNLKGQILDGIHILVRLLRWLQKNECSNNLQQLAYDARRFMTAFSHSSASKSTPHIYISMLPFWPQNLPVSTYYLPKVPGLASVTGSGTRLGNPDLVTTINVDDLVSCVAYSPNGAYILSDSGDNLIRFWDAHTGQLVGQPLEGHPDGVTSVAFAPDGAHVVSGSVDGSIRIWNARTRQPVGETLEGHTDVVTSVAYSPNGASIASGSEDETIRIWNARTRQPVGEPLQGHNSLVNSVAYSPNGAYLVSCSEDIRIWDVRSRQLVGRPFGRDMGRITCVAYSRDGAHVAANSSSWDIRIWDTRTAQCVGRIEEHVGRVTALAYSPDGRYIVSGSQDKTVRICDARTGQPLGQPLEGHTSWITSVAYSPDGAYVVSASADNTICVWAAQIKQLVDHPRTNVTKTNLVPKQSSSVKGPLSDGWTLDDQGWVIVGQRRLVWVPSHLRDMLELAEKTMPVSHDRSFQIDLNGAALGEEWQRCFDVNPVS
ncbi:hypothetical protein FRC08_010488 [Ceratobasidium sp. 394]|nr:hypothetical protein FRC08_010488 [Ceratobasidium sp. 394]KAG9101290.1 hypothetical protein FS749_008262 [Ceratobasidium sp. UAMH 11750]